MVICPSAWNVFTSKQRELLRSGFIGPRKQAPDVNGGVVAAVANVQSQARRWSEEGKEAEQNGDKHGVVLYGHRGVTGREPRKEHATKTGRGAGGGGGGGGGGRSTGKGCVWEWGEIDLRDECKTSEPC